MKTKIAVIAAVFSIFLIGGLIVSLDQKDDETQTQSTQTLSFQNITSSELAAMLDQKDFFFVNVHIPYEGELKKTDAFIPYNKIDKNLSRLPKDKNAKIVLYCRSGRMSEIAAQKLTNLGYTNVYNHTGGMIDWEAKGYAVIKK